jgi:Tol biopolymer transport system component
MEQAAGRQRKRTTPYPIAHSSLVKLRLIILLTLTLLLVACEVPLSGPTQVVVKTALPTPTLEPTFTPSPPPTNTPRPSPTASPTGPILTPTPQSVLSGRILDQDTDQPVTEAEVRAGTASTTTDAEGRYTLIGLPPGQYVLSVTHSDYDPGLSSIFTLAAGGEQSLNLVLYAPDTSSYPKDPMLTNPLDPNGAPTAEDAERLARRQGMTGEVVNIKETTLTGEYLVNYKIGDEVRAAVAELNHEAWELTDDAGRQWWILKVCGNLASPLPAEMAVATPQPRPLPPMAEVLVDGLIVRECASEECAEVGTVERGARIEVVGCTADGSWCEVGLPDGGSGWCKRQSLRQLAVAQAVPVVEAVLLIAKSGVVATGEKIAFVSNRDGNDEIYVMNVDGSDLKRLTSHPDDDQYPDWSPDGKQIAFSRDGIYIMNPDGSDQTRLTEFGGCPAWSPDGRRIAFSHSQDLYVMNADGSGLTHLGSNINCPTWLPDGNYIAHFLAGTWVVKIDTSNYSRIIDGTGPICSAMSNNFNYVRCQASIPDANFATWSFDGQRIAFESYGRDHDSEIYTVNSDGSGLIRLTNQPGRDTFPTWSPDGQRIAFMSERSGNAEIYVMNSDGNGLMRLTEHSADDRDPTWSPVAVAIAEPVVENVLSTPTPAIASVEQGKIVFTCVMYDYKMNDDGTFVTHPVDGSKIFDEKKEICVINADGSGLTRLTYHSERNYARDPAWSPDKKRIAFSDDGNIYMMNADGSDITRLTSNPDRFESAPTWSPDGQRIAFCSSTNQGGPSIYVMNADGSGLTHLIDHYCFNPEWSPDGSKIALDNFEVMNTDGSNLVSLIDGSGNSPGWSPNGQKIVYSRLGSPNSDFLVISADGSGLTPLTNFPASEYWPNWSPDGQKIVFHSNRHATGGTYDLYIMNADGSGVTRLTEQQDLNGGLTRFVDASYPDW